MVIMVIFIIDILKKRTKYKEVKQKYRQNLYQPGVQSNLLLDSMSASRCRLDTRCICARKAIVLESSPNALVNFLDVFAPNEYQNDELFQSEL